PDLRERNHADEHAVFVHVGQPRDDATVRLRPDPFRHHVGVEQKTHNSISRGPSLDRLILRSEPRRGDAAKNSARLPRRLVLRCHSSADTTTTAFCPLRVMVCGPTASARSIISLNRALASATAQVSRTWPLRRKVVILVMVV